MLALRTGVGEYGICVRTATILHARRAGARCVDHARGRGCMVALIKAEALINVTVRGHGTHLAPSRVEDYGSGS